MTSSKPSHRERAQLARQRRREHHSRPNPAPSGKACPTPTKKAYADQGDACADAVELSRRSGKSWAPYPCDCGRWHLAGADRWRIRRGEGPDGERRPR